MSHLLLRWDFVTEIVLESVYQRCLGGRVAGQAD